MLAKPLADRVIIKLKDPESVSSGGILIPPSAKEKSQEGEVIAVGPGRVEDGKLIPMELKVGDQVLFGGPGTEIKVDDEDCVIIQESDVFAKL